MLHERDGGLAGGFHVGGRWVRTGHAGAVWLPGRLGGWGLPGGSELAWLPTRRLVSPHNNTRWERISFKKSENNLESDLLLGGKDL
jgi:hypothetical protein